MAQAQVHGVLLGGLDQGWFVGRGKDLAERLHVLGAERAAVEDRCRCFERAVVESRTVNVGRTDEDDQGDGDADGTTAATPGSAAL